MRYLDIGGCVRYRGRDGYVAELDGAVLGAVREKGPAGRMKAERLVLSAVDAEVAERVEWLERAYPDLGSRPHKAGALIALGRIRALGGGVWEVISQRGNDAYEVDFDPAAGWGCDCKDWWNGELHGRGAPWVDEIGSRVCKHVLACMIYDM